MGEAGKQEGVVGDEEKGRRGLGLDAAKQGEDGGLGDGVQGGGGLIGNDEGGTADERLGDDDTLTLAAAELVGVGGGGAGREPDRFEHGAGCLGGGAGGAGAMGADDVGDLRLTPEDGVEGVERFL